MGILHIATKESNQKSVSVHCDKQPDQKLAVYYDSLSTHGSVPKYSQVSPWLMFVLINDTVNMEISITVQLHFYNCSGNWIPFRINKDYVKHC